MKRTLAPMTRKIESLNNGILPINFSQLLPPIIFAIHIHTAVALWEDLVIDHRRLH
jgi:hypothetical protein